MVVTARVISLPILEPLTPDRLACLAELGCSCLIAALSMAAVQHTTGADSNEQLESLANSIVEKSMSVFVQIICCIQHSNQAGGGQVQNLRALGCWTLAVGLKELLEADFCHNYITLGLCSQCLALFAPLVMEVRQEPLSLSPEEKFDVNSSISAGQRLAFIDSTVPIMPLLFSMLLSGFNQAITLAQENQHDMNGTDGDRSPKAKESLESESSAQVKPLDNTERLSETTSEQGEAEPLIGSWLEKVLSSVPALVETALREKSSTSPVSSRPRRSGTTDSLPSFLLEKSELQNHLSVAVNATMILIDFANTSYCRHGNDEMGCGKLTSKEIKILATVGFELDSYLENHGTDLKFAELINLVLKLQHNLLALDRISSGMQDELLSYIGVTIRPSALNDPWPLQLGCRALNLVGQILMLRTQSGKSDGETTIVIVWERFLNAMGQQILCDGVEPVDVNVEHLQLLLFLFHSLQLLQKKTVLLKLCEKIVSIVIDGNRKYTVYRGRKCYLISIQLILFHFSRLGRHPPTHLARLLQIFEYMMKHFYEPPVALLEHVVANICPLNSNFDSSVKSSKGGPILAGAKRYFPCPETEDVYRMNVPYAEQKKMKPFFYHIIPTDISTAHEVPRLDGLVS